MIIVAKVNVLTDDSTVPPTIRQQLEGILRQHLQDALDGGEPARVHLEFKSTVSSTPYMQGLTSDPTHELRLPPAVPNPTRHAAKVAKRTAHQARVSRAR